VTLPRAQPIIPISKKDPFDDPGWLFDLKYDGFRALLYIEQGIRCRFVSRNGNILSRFDALCQAVSAALDIDSVILDGEVIAADESGRPLFYDLVRASRKPAYVAFDLLWLNGADLLLAPQRAPAAPAWAVTEGITGHLRSAVGSRQGTRPLQAYADSRPRGNCRLLFHISAALAENERDVIHERTIAGLASARARGARAAGRRN